MKRSKILGILTVAAMALMAFASTASATTLEVKGAKKSEGITIKASLKAGTSALLTDTAGFFANTCTVSTVEGTTETEKIDIIEGKEVKTSATYTAAGTGPISGPITALSWGTTATPCKEGNPTVDAKGELSVEWIKGSTNGTVKSKNAKVTVPSALGLLTCTTPEGGTDLGTITGVATGFATMDINAVLACGIDAKWTGTYSVTSPEGLGVIE